jgi:hypothetical protein
MAYDAAFAYGQGTRVAKHPRSGIDVYAISNDDADGRAGLLTVTACNLNQAMDVAVATDFHVRMETDAPSVMVKPCSKTDRAFGRQNALEKQMQDSLDHPGYQRYLVQITPARDRMKT